MKYSKSFSTDHEIRLRQKYLGTWLADCLKQTQQAKHMQIRGMQSLWHNKQSMVIRWKGQLSHLYLGTTWRDFFNCSQWHIRNNFAQVHYEVMIRFKRLSFLLGKKPSSCTLCAVCQALNGASTEYCSWKHTDHCNVYKCLWAGLMQVWNQRNSKDEFGSGKAMTRIWNWSVTTADPAMDVVTYQTETPAWKWAATLMAWESTSITTANSHKRNPQRWDCRREVVRNRKCPGLRK